MNMFIYLTFNIQGVDHWSLNPRLIIMHLHFVIIRLLTRNKVQRKSKDWEIRNYFNDNITVYKIWDCPGGDYKDCCLLGYNNPVRTSQETRYVSATETSRLILCKIRSFHGGDYEECLLGYNNSVRTSQETHYVSARDSSHLMLCKIWGFHGSDYEECLLGYNNPVRTSQEAH
jgi:hypothetical protein